MNKNFFRLGLALAMILGPANSSFSQAVKVEDLLKSLQIQVGRTNYGKALELADQIISLKPRSAQGYLARGQVHDLKNDFDLAIADFTQALALDPKARQIYQQRGSVHFKAGHIKESIADFDKVIELQPAQAPYHWQRGIALYEAGRFDEGQKQFELHQKVNTNDVENSAWHFLCVARSKGFDQAREALLKIEHDRRVPMMQVFALYQGKGSIDDIFNAVKKDSPTGQELNHRLFYANFYAGMFFEARDGDKMALDYINRAVEKSAGMDYMSDVARIHADLLKKRIEAKPNLKK